MLPTCNVKHCHMPSPLCYIIYCYMINCNFLQKYLPLPVVLICIKRKPHFTYLSAGLKNFTDKCFLSLITFLKSIKQGFKFYGAHMYILNEIKATSKQNTRKNHPFSFLSFSFFPLITLHNTMSLSLDSCIFRSTPEMTFWNIILRKYCTCHHKLLPLRKLMQKAETYWNTKGRKFKRGWVQSLSPLCNHC